MTLYRFHDDSGAAIDAHFEVQSGELILHSRGGTRGSSNERNTDYNSDLLILLLKRISCSGLTLDGVWVDSNRVQNLPLKQRQIFFPEDDRGVSPGDLAKRFSDRMALVGQGPNARGGNRTKRLRFAFAEVLTDEQTLRIANG